MTNLQILCDDTRQICIPPGTHMYTYLLTYPLLYHRILLVSYTIFRNYPTLIWYGTGRVDDSILGPISHDMRVRYTLAKSVLDTVRGTWLRSLVPVSFFKKRNGTPVWSRLNVSAAQASPPSHTNSKGNKVATFAATWIIHHRPLVLRTEGWLTA